MSMPAASARDEAAGHATAPLAAPSDVRLIYDGRTGEILRLWLKVQLLNVVTIGFYRFWGRTRIREYLWSHVSLLDDRFEYDGTGGELFRRFLATALVVLPLLFVADVMLLFRVGLAYLQAVHIAQGFLLVCLGYVAQYGGRRYRLSRTLWRGIRGGLDGSAYIYAVKGFRYAATTTLTFGFLLPWQLAGLWSYTADNAGFGDGTFHFDGKGRHLCRRYLVSWGLVVGGFAAFFAFGGVLAAVFHLGKVPADAALKYRVGALMAVALVLWIALAAYSYLRFSREAINFLAAHLHFGRVGFSAPVRKRDLLRLRLGNLLISMLTLGLGAAFTAHRSLRFLCANLQVHDAEALDQLTQAPGRRRARGGEGLVQLLDTGGFA
jgi:uncharacterized membrane protein YjgN (DUF898 family)